MILLDSASHSCAGSPYNVDLFSVSLDSTDGRQGIGNAAGGLTRVVLIGRVVIRGLTPMLAFTADTSTARDG